jgi:cell wall-associated NlpC family hydrolase
MPSGPVDLGATAMSNGGGATLRLGRHAPIVLVLALLVALAGGTAVGAAPAAPDAALAAKARALQARLDAQNAEVERLAERLNATDDRRHRLQQRLARLQARQHAAQRELDTAQRQLDEQVRATYMNGPQWLLGELVGGANPPDAMRRIPMEKAALEARAAVVTQVRIRKAEVDGLNERLATDLAEADLVHRRQAEERRQVQRMATQLQATLDRIDQQLAGYLEAEQVRSEAARRAAWSGYVSGVGSVQSWLQAGPVARAAARWALAQLGDPYQWGATGPDTFDCSGLTSSAYRAAGVSIPRVSRAQWGAGPHVQLDRLLPGDLVFFADNPLDPATIHHVGMYIGNGLMVHAPHTGDVVRVASVWREGYVGATRIVPGVVTPGLPGPPPTAPPPTSPTPPTPPPMTTSPPTTAKPAPAPPTTRPPTSTSKATTTTRAATTTTAPPTTAAAATTTEAPTTTTEPPTTTGAPPTTTAEAPTASEPPTSTTGAVGEATTTTQAATTTTTAAASDEPTISTTPPGS